MQEVCAETIADARRWVRSEEVDARGMTDILAPLKLALAMLEGVQGALTSPHAVGNSSAVLPSRANSAPCIHCKAHAANRLTTKMSSAHAAVPPAGPDVSSPQDCLFCVTSSLSTPAAAAAA